MAQENEDRRNILDRRTVGSRSRRMVRAALSWVCTQPSPGGGRSRETSNNDNRISFGHAYGFQKSEFEYQELADATDDFSQSKIIGRGGNGTVYKGTLANGKDVAVKVHGLNPGERAEREFFGEIEVTGRLHHVNLVTLVGYCVTLDKRILVYEFVSNGTLSSHLHGNGEPLNWQTRRNIAIGCARGLEYLHHYCDPRIIHRDIKPSNILLDEHFEAKIADFGNLKYMSRTMGSSQRTEVVGTPGYMDEEYFNTGTVTFASDIYSFGVVLLELITGQKAVERNEPDPPTNIVESVREVFKKNKTAREYDGLVDEKLARTYDEEQLSSMIECARACVFDNPQDRPDARTITRMLEGTLIQRPNPEVVLRSDPSSSYQKCR